MDGADYSQQQGLEAELHEATVKAIQEAVSKGVGKPAVLMFCWQAGVNVNEIYQEAAHG